jgi:tetratricopeptide (TPR) repeat protein
VAEDIRGLSDALARNPASLRYADLAELLRRRGDGSQALRVAERGLARHPEHADGLDCLGRIHADRGELDRARDAWARALAVAPDHVGALKGMGFTLFRAGDAAGAAVLLARVVEAAPADEGARRALAMVRREAAAAPPAGAAPMAGAPAASAPMVEAADERPPVFRGLEGATADILLCDDRGRVIAGGLTGADGGDVSELAAAALAGVSGEAQRTARYLGLGAWATIVAETDRANLVLAPVTAGALLLVRRDRSVPIGLAVRVAERALGAASAWLERQGA